MIKPMLPSTERVPRGGLRVPSVLTARYRGRVGGSQLGQLSFYQKDPATWNIVKDGASGNMKYNIFDGEFDFVFNGCGLHPGIAYCLTCNPGPRPGARLNVLGSGEADEAGNIHIVGSALTKSVLPDDNSAGDAVLWLVLASDVDAGGSMMIDWNPGKYLFEHDLFIFDSSCEEEFGPPTDRCYS